MANLAGILSRIGFHAVYERGLREAIDLACRYDFSSVQIETAMPQFFPERYDEDARRKIRRYAEDRNITLKVHAPGEDFSLQTLHHSIQRAILDRLKEVTDFACDLGARLATIHPGIVPAFTIPGSGTIPISRQYPKPHLQGLKTALLELSEYCGGRVLLCIENSPFTSNVMKVLSPMLKEGRAFLAWDLAKMYLSDGKIIREDEDFFLRHVGKVRECHLHDRTKEHGHQIIGEGFVDFRKYLKLLSNYDVGYTIEVRPIENALKSLQALRKILGITQQSVVV